MENKSKQIRDFIYVDGDRLYSLYSQVFEGVADQIVKSKLYGELQKESQKGSLLKGEIAEAQFAEVTQLTENKVLYDHMYEQLEAKIRNAIITPSDISAENFRDKLKDIFIVRVSGKAEIEDYNRVKVFTDNFNKIAGAIAFSTAITQLGMPLYRAETIAGNVQGKDKAGMKAYVQKLKKPEQLAKDAGLFQDELAMSNISFFTEMFYPDGFEITIIPTQGAEGVVYRGVLDRQWLRMQPEMLRALYGGYTESEWTMVGQITYLPGVEISTIPQVPPQQATSAIAGAEQNTSETRASNPTEENPSMRDPFREVFRGLRGFERMFLESKQRIEVIVCPLAIFREITVSI